MVTSQPSLNIREMPSEILHKHPESWAPPQAYYISISIKSEIKFCYGLSCVSSPKKYIGYVSVVILSISECDLTEGWSLYRGYQVKMRLLRWVLIQYDYVLMQRGNLDGSRQAQTKTIQRNTARRRSSQVKERDLEGIIPSQPLEKTNPLMP